METYRTPNGAIVRTTGGFCIITGRREESFPGDYSSAQLEFYARTTDPIRTKEPDEENGECLRPDN